MVLGIIELQIDPQLLGGLLEGGRIGGPPATLGTGLDETHDPVRVGGDPGRLLPPGGPPEPPLGDLNHQAGASFSRAAIHWTAAPPLPQFPWGAMSSGVRPTLGST